MHRDPHNLIAISMVEEIKKAYRHGDVVKLKSGGYQMTVCRDARVDIVAPGAWSIKCQWHNGFGDMREAEIDLELIRHHYPAELSARLRETEAA